MTRPRTIGSALVFCCLFAGPAVAEIINLSVSGEVSGSESAVFCEDCPQDNVFATFSNMNSQLGYGVYGLRGSGLAQSVVFHDDPEAVASGSAQQTAVTTNSGFSVDLRSDASYGGLVFLLGTSSVANTLIVSFHLTERSVLELTGSLNAQCSEVFGQGNPCPFSFPFEEAEGIDLSGSGFDFSRQANFFTNEVPIEPFEFLSYAECWRLYPNSLV